jgi:hypothetical protein
MLRLIDGDPPGAVVITHAHNQRPWSPSHGQPLPPEGYRDLFETIDARLFSEAGLFADVVAGRPLDLSRRDSGETLDRDPALVIVASRSEEVFKPHPVDTAPGEQGELRLNPLYVVEPDGDRVRLRLQFPSAEYEDEFGHGREYLPDEVALDKTSLAALNAGHVAPELKDLVRRRVILDLPKRYY